MHPLTLQSSSRLIAAQWLAERLSPFGSGVASIVPNGFAAYSRILHPALDPGDVKIRWAAVAGQSGRTMHRLAQFNAINLPPVSISVNIVASPQPGNLAADQLKVLCAALAAHTTTPESCWFCLWEGYGWLHGQGMNTLEFQPAGTLDTPAPIVAGVSASVRTLTVLRNAARNAPRVNLPHRNYLLFEGPLEAATAFGWTMAEEFFVPQSPNLFWPSDHAWCVASEIDLFCTLVAGPDELVEKLIADPRLEAWRVYAGDPTNAYSDDLNK